MTEYKPVESWLTDMDGVLVHEERVIPGASEFIATLQASGKKFLVLTNNSIFTRGICMRDCLPVASTFPRPRSGRPRSRPRSSWTTSDPAVRRT